MPKFKVIFYFPDGTVEESEEIFDTEAEAEEFGGSECGAYAVGAEVLHLSNPSDKQTIFQNGLKMLFAS